MARGRTLPRRRKKIVDRGASKVSVKQPHGLSVQLHIETIKNVFSEEVLLDMKPLTDLGRGLGTLIRNRVRFRGRSATGGQFSRYPKRKDRPKAGKRNDPHEYETLEPYWAPKHYPQGPESSQLSHKVRGGGSTPLKSKKHKGARAYPSRVEYQIAIAKNPKKKFTIMGDFWTGLKVRPVRPTYIRLAFFKSSFTNALRKKKLANRTKASQMNKHEKVSILQPNKKEMKWANEYVRLYITSSFLDSIGAQELRIKAFRAGARIEKRIKAFAKKFGGR